MNTSPVRLAVVDVNDLAEKAQCQIFEAIRDRRDEILAMAKDVLQNTPPERAPIMRLGFAVKIDLRTSTVSFELAGAVRWKERSEVQVIGQQVLDFTPQKTQIAPTEV